MGIECKMYNIFNLEKRGVEIACFPYKKVYKKKIFY